MTRGTGQGRTQGQHLYLLRCVVTDGEWPVGAQRKQLSFPYLKCTHGVLTELPCALVLVPWKDREHAEGVQPCRGDPPHCTVISQFIFIQLRYTFPALLQSC